MKLLILDDFGMVNFTPNDARNGTGLVCMVIQVPVEHWYDTFPLPTIADAIMDRLVHNSYQIEMRGESMKKRIPILMLAQPWWILTLVGIIEKTIIPIAWTILQNELPTVSTSRR